jgi:hypothetical protein
LQSATKDNIFSGALQSAAKNSSVALCKMQLKILFLVALCKVPLKIGSGTFQNVTKNTYF